ncbi:DUF7284 family protein [Halovenus salina]|uniref:DUF7284 family protein n=1 Tax=Halovenus salina TaxID=1510225 RepID=UPI0022609B4E|nr:hypothetical protein [Halovenus salina]
MTGNRRAISTVVDVTLGLLVIVAAMGLLVTLTETKSADHNPTDAAYAAQTVTGSTVNTTYSLAPAIEHYFSEYRKGKNPYEGEELDRVSQGPVATQVADLAVATAAVDGKQFSAATTAYKKALEETLWTRLRGSRFDLSVTAHWQPVKGVPLQGTVTLGERPPSDADVSATTFTVPSGVPDARQNALDAVDGPDDYRAVARVVANATVEGLFSPLETQRALERTGVNSHLTRYRYERLTSALDGDPERFERRGWLSPSSANATAANAYLSRRLTAVLETQLEETHASAVDAARTVSTGTVTITVRTWTHE